MIVVERAAGYLAVQDLGRPGHRADGVAASGAIDPLAHRLANALVGNADLEATLEWSVGEAVLRFTRETRIAVAGAGARATIDGEPAPLWTSLPARAGSVLRLEPAPGGRFCHVAAGGGIDVPLVLGSRSTYLPARFGGHEGRPLRAGDRLPVGDAPSRAPAAGAAVAEPIRGEDDPDAPLRIVAAAQGALLDDEGWRALLEGEHRVGPGDRMGLRLDGVPVRARAPDALPSEGACAGAIQIPGDGRPIVLMPDGPTVGGYPKPAVVASVDLRRLAQRPLGAPVRFARVEVAEAQRLRREAEELVAAARAELLPWRGASP